MNRILAVDTSCYTTSVALMEDDRLLYDKRKLLMVPAGKKGLRQSEAVFQHLQNFPELLGDMKGILPTIDLFAVSSVPRRQTGSYLPVFTAGVRLVESLAVLSGKGIIYTSHQEGHLAAGEWSLGGALPAVFLAGQFSGGTSELLIAEKTKNGYKYDIIARTSDLHAGQMIDRVGVALGLPFPAGPALEKLAAQVQNSLQKLPVSVTEDKISFSGPETAALKLIKRGITPPEVAFATLDCIARTLAKIIKSAVAKTGIKAVLLTGGVMANLMIREFLLANVQADFYFARPEYSSDNAVGVAYLGYKSLEAGEV